MSGVIRPTPSGDQIAANIDALRSQGASDHDIEAYLQQEGLQPDSGITVRPRPVAQPFAAPPSVDPSAASMGLPMQVAAHALNTAQGMPGMAAVEAFMGSLGSRAPWSASNPMTYTESLNALRGMTSGIGGKTSALEHIVGSIPFMGIPGASSLGPVAGGAMYGGADQLLSADPNLSLTDRALRTAAGAGAGALVGKVGDALLAAGRAGGGALLNGLGLPGGVQNPAALLIQKQADRALSAKNLYTTALAEGQGKVGTQAIRDFLAEDDIAPIVDRIANSRQGAMIGRESPEMLDRVYKELSDQSGNLKKSLGVADPRSANSRQFQAREIELAKNKMLDLMSGSPETMLEAGSPPPMPSYRAAVQDYQRRSVEINAIKRGMDAIKAAASPTKMVGSRAATKTTPEAFAEWARTAKPEELVGAQAGLLGNLRNALAAPLTEGRRAAFAAPKLLRTTGANTSAGLLAMPVATQTLGLLSPQRTFDSVRAMLP